MMMQKLTPKRQAFVNEYLIDLNGTQAAIRAGYSIKTADQLASRLLTKDKVKTAIENAFAERAKRTQIDADWVVKKFVENIDRAMQDRPVYDRKGEETGEYVYDGAVVNVALRSLGDHLRMFPSSAPTVNVDNRNQFLVSFMQLAKEALEE